MKREGRVGVQPTGAEEVDAGPPAPHRNSAWTLRDSERQACKSPSPFLSFRFSQSLNTLPDAVLLTHLLNY